ncbi:UNVERIFIED_CONTAM: hypothetical protein Sangu_1995100 [Sesamum angustifolium]|uniref:Uncharacterized protein n=1 Tax=Sesamum angustifolium TaxID=2727405 RepID=A0AAW2LH17_9LAMI
MTIMGLLQRLAVRMTPLLTFPTSAAPHLPTPTPVLGLNPAFSATLTTTATTMSATSTPRHPVGHPFQAEKDPSLQSQERTQVNGPRAQIHRRQSTLSEPALMRAHMCDLIVNLCLFVVILGF